MTNGTIFFFCSTSAISALLFCAKNSSLISCLKLLAKRMQEQKEEERTVAKSKSTAMNLSSAVSASSSSAKDPIASKRPGILKASQESWEFSETESWSNHEKEVTEKPVASRNSRPSENSKAGNRKWPHNFHMSPAVVPHTGKVYSIVRKIYGQSPMDDLNDLDVNTAVWCIFVNVTLQAAVRLGRDYIERIYDLPRIKC